MTAVNQAEFSYANPEHPLLKRWTIRAIEGISGRGKLVDLYGVWKHTMVGTSDYIWNDLLGLINLDVSVTNGEWPPENLPEGPLVLIANHPYGIGDGLAVLALAEQLNRPFKILINRDLLKVPEVRPFSLPVDFEETKQALKTNMETRKEALRLLQEGTTIIVFPGGGVATASTPFGRAQELPWKTFTAKMIRTSKATVLPLYFDGQNSWLFHLVSKYSLTLRLSLLVREFRRILGSVISARAGQPIPFETLSGFKDQKEVMDFLQTKVMEMAPTKRSRLRRRRQIRSSK
jgi:putative hemolysin